jgi:hypothetical protein
LLFFSNIFNYLNETSRSVDADPTMWTIATNPFISQ